MQDLIGIAIRISVLYGYTLLLLRLSGKRSLNSMSPLDFLVGLIIGDLFDDMIWAEIPLAQGLVGLTTMLLLHTLLAFATYRSGRLDEIVNSRPVRVIRERQLAPDGMRQERTRAGEIEMELRLRGEEKLEEIREGLLEPSGQLSVKKYFHARPLQKGDLQAQEQTA